MSTQFGNIFSRSSSTVKFQEHVIPSLEILRVQLNAYVRIIAEFFHLFLRVGQPRLSSIEITLVYLLYSMNLITIS